MLCSATLRSASGSAPIGQFNFLASTLSPLEVPVEDRPSAPRQQATASAELRRARDAGANHCSAAASWRLFLPRKVGNLDCAFCLDCVHACPHDNVALAARLAGRESCATRAPLGPGPPPRRPDLAVLATVFMFGGLLNAFGMVSPVYAA